MIENWDPLDDNILVRYVSDKMDQVEHLEHVVDGVEYRDERREEVMGSEGELIATKTVYNHLSPAEVVATRDMALFRLKMYILPKVGVRLDLYNGPAV